MISLLFKQLIDKKLFRLLELFKLHHLVRLSVNNNLTFFVLCDNKWDVFLFGTIHHSNQTI